MPARTVVSSSASRVALRSEEYICPSCLWKQGALTPVKAAKPSHYRRITTTSRTFSRPEKKRLAPCPTLRLCRYTSSSSLASTTAVNAPAAVPAHLRELHHRLQLLQEKASSYVNLSRLQLALRSLESSDPIVRVAFLGLGGNGLGAARKLAKVLLADELGDEEAWEKVLTGPDDGRSILLRYGETVEETGVQGSSASLVREMRIPSARLRRWNVEVLITGLHVSGYAPSNTTEALRDLEESILVPPITMPNSSGGRIGFVRYPVHKALVVAEGISGAVEFGHFPSELVDGALINAALSLPLRVDIKNAPLEHNDTREVAHENSLSIDLAEHALDLFRSSIANGAVYSEQWQQSRVSIISDWLANSSSEVSKENGLKPEIEKMLSSVLLRTGAAIVNAEAIAQDSSTALTVPEPKRTLLQSAIAKWSEDAHQDLQMNLAAALATPTWRRTTWWRLFWRIDEVSISAGDLLRRGWLVEAEQNLAFVAGRLLEAGVAKTEELKGEPLASHAGSAEGANDVLHPEIRREVEHYKNSAQNPEKDGTVAELLQMPPMLVKIKEQTGLNTLFDPPWPQTIHIAREQKLHRTVPAMHQRAQVLLLSSLSTTGGSGALAGWLWVASGGVALYEAGAIATLGLVWSLRRLQKSWSKERQSFVEMTAEDGRTVLAHVERRLNKLVQEGGRVPVRAEERREWIAAKEAVQACQEAKDKVIQLSQQG